jgi:hypothetical protein
MTIKNETNRSTVGLPAQILFRARQHLVAIVQQAGRSLP